MANLDDFFAKKDKKKKGTKGFSKANTEVIAKNLEEIEAKELKLQQEKQEYTADIILKSQFNKSKDEEEEEWNEYREKLKDYSVLKIDSVRLVDSIDTEDTEVVEEEEREGKKKEEEGEKEKKTEGESDDEEDDKEESDEEKENQEVLSGFIVKSSYVPPHLREKQPTKEVLPPKRSQNRRMKHAPDISSEVYFPSLSNTVEDAGPKGAWGKKLEM